MKNRILHLQSIHLLPCLQLQSPLMFLNDMGKKIKANEDMSLEDTSAQCIKEISSLIPCSLDKFWLQCLS